MVSASLCLSARGAATTRLLNSAQESRIAIAAITIATMPSTTAATNQFVRTRRV
jgi:hypothetical protein